MTPTATFPQPAIKEYSPPVMVVLPWQKQVSPVTSLCVAQIVDRRRTATCLGHGNPLVARARNTCASVLLGSLCEWSLWIDDDMVIPFGDGTWYRANTGFDFAEDFLWLNALDRLMSHGKTDLVKPFIQTILNVADWSALTPLQWDDNI